MLNFSLRKHLGDKVEQRGSLVTPDKLRFDFSHSKPLTAEQIQLVEALINQIISSDLAVFDQELEYEVAKTLYGLRTVPGEVYPDPVRLISIGRAISELLDNPTNPDWINYSLEFCGGTHLKRTGLLENFTITQEEAVGKGVRRIVAVSGYLAEEAIRNAENLEKRIASLEKLEARDNEVKEQISQILSLLSNGDLPAAKVSHLRNAISNLQARLRKVGKDSANAFTSAANTFTTETIESLKANPKKFFVSKVADSASGTQLTDTIKKIQSDPATANTAILLFSTDPKAKKVLFVANVPKELSQKLPANEWANHAAAVIGGKGGGKGETAQGSGPHLDKVDLSIDAANAFATQRLN
jgi:alanyl-tRNA synthetase